MTEPKPTFDALGTSGATFERLETFESPPGVRAVILESDELSALCPVTMQPDSYTVLIELVGTPRLLESKSLKLYLGTFRNQGIFCETLAAQIAEAVYGVVGGGRVIVNVIQKRRGGIKIQAAAMQPTQPDQGDDDILSFFREQIMGERRGRDGGSD